MFDRTVDVFYIELEFTGLGRHFFFDGVGVVMQCQYQTIGHKHPAENCQ